MDFVSYRNSWFAPDFTTFVIIHQNNYGARVMLMAATGHIRHTAIEPERKTDRFHIIIFIIY